MASDRREATVVVVTGGDAPSAAMVAALPQGVPVIAADSGLEHAIALGLQVDVVVGDLDSVDRTVLQAAEAAGTTVERHPREKDATDLELALRCAVRHHPERVVVVGGHGGRLDHLLANMLVLASPTTAGCEVVALVGAAVLTVVRPGRPVALLGDPGELVTLVPVHGAALGVRTDGLRYPLHGERLDAGHTRGVSNELVASRAGVSIDDGVLLAVQPASRTAEVLTDQAVPPASRQPPLDPDRDTPTRQGASNP